MRLALILMLTMLLLRCDEIRVKTGSGETEIEPLRWEFINSYSNSEQMRGWLLNKETGQLETCRKYIGRDFGSCTRVVTTTERAASEQNSIEVGRILNEFEPNRQTVP